MIGGFFLLRSRQNHRAPFGSHHNLVFGVFEFIHRNKTTPNTGRMQRRLVDKVCQIRTRKARSTARDNAQINVWPQWCLARMDV